MSGAALGRTDLIRQRDGRPLGIFRARVVDNLDPLQRGRLKLLIPEVSGTDGAHPQWAAPALGFGKGSGKIWGSTLWMPEIGDVVWVLFVASDSGAVEEYPVWLPGWALDGAVPALLLTHYPKRRGLVTPSGHSLHFDDDTGADANSGEVKLAHRDGAALRFSPDGHAHLDSKGGAKVQLQGGGAAAAREGDAVRVTIPAGTVVVAVAMGAAVMNAAPIELDGTIVGPCSATTEIG